MTSIFLLHCKYVANNLYVNYNLRAFLERIIKIMRKILLPILSLVSVILVAIAFGIAAQTAATRVDGSNFGNYYQLVFERGSNVFATLSFVFLIIATVALVVCLIPFKFRKFVLPGASVLFILTGVFMILAPKHASDVSPLTVTGSMTATAVLLIVTGAVLCLMTVLSFLGKKESK